ncbi:hypothetical protein ONS95_002868 [Cadophora gregata]|uniref:uncharacterized protein n=1 Tax=Cadophora gregata TaxID=51156 RepID=UPI0026DB9155|nr:uncharacterized protein ONS95_002868 [Cadophora gregata]KAK0108043.1 hypothetical protein ONS95_002868 [Cadophora gregata]
MYFTLFLLPAVAAAATIPGLSLNCAPKGTIMPTPKYGTQGAVFTVCAQTSIRGTASTIYNALLEFPRYHEWNTFVYDVKVPATVTSAQDVYIGMPMTFHTYGLIPVLNSTSQEIISYLEPGYQTPFAGWFSDAGLGLAGLQAQHISLLRDLGGGLTEYVSWETYYGAGAVVVAGLKDRLLTQFENQGRDLKLRVESLGK